MVRPPRFDAAWNRRRTWLGRWRKWRGLLLLTIAGAFAWWIASGPGWKLGERLGIGAQWTERSDRFAICGQRPARACVIDGDTVMIGQRRIRLTGFDAPELEGGCDAESALALQSQAALREWLNRAPFQLDGGAEPARDDYGRELRAVRRIVEGRTEWLEDDMIDRHLARRSRLDRGWCG